MDIWRQMVAAKEAKAKAAQVQAAEDDARSQAAAAEEERVAVMLPTTARVPPHVRPAGVRRQPWQADDELSTNQPEDGQAHWSQHPSPLKPLESRQGAEQGSYRENSSRGMLQQQESFLSDEPPRDHSFAEEWSQELDRAFREQLPPRGANTMSFLKQKFMRSGTLEAAREVGRRIRHECVLMGEGGSNALRHTWSQLSLTRGLTAAPYYQPLHRECQQLPFLNWISQGSKSLHRMTRINRQVQGSA